VKLGIEEKRKEKGVEEGCMVILAKSEREMKVMVRSLEREEEKAGSECRQDENDSVQQEKEKE
jgi:hypothetical protein